MTVILLVIGWLSLGLVIGFMAGSWAAAQAHRAQGGPR